MKKEKNFLEFKNENGSITLFVLIAMLFFLIIVWGIYFGSQNKLQTQTSEIDEIKRNYEKETSIENMNSIYDNIVNSTVSIEFSSNGGEFAMPTENKAKIETKVNTKTENVNIIIDRIYYQWAENREKPERWEEEIKDGDTVSKEDCEIGSYYLWIKVIDSKGKEEIHSSKEFKVREANIEISYEGNIINPPLNAKIKFDSILTKNYKAGEGTTEELAKSTKKAIEVNNNEGNINVLENGYIYVEATDDVGNLVYKIEKIENIDNKGPEIEYDPNGGNYELNYIYI